jgi:hypothetical protein
MVTTDSTLAKQHVVLHRLLIAGNLAHPLDHHVHSGSRWTD